MATGVNPAGGRQLRVFSFMPCNVAYLVRLASIPSSNRAACRKTRVYHSEKHIAYSQELKDHIRNGTMPIVYMHYQRADYHVSLCLTQQRHARIKSQSRVRVLRHAFSLNITASLRRQPRRWHHWPKRSLLRISHVAQRGTINTPGLKIVRPESVRSSYIFGAAHKHRRDSSAGRPWPV